VNADQRHVGFRGLRLTVSGRNILACNDTWMARMAPTPARRRLQEQLSDRFEIDHDALSGNDNRWRYKEGTPEVEGGVVAG
jgi:hypothetical protein